MNYVLVTACRNEEKLIEGTLESVCGQTVLPSRWIIVDDGSTDRTAAIISRFAEKHSWIMLHRRQREGARSFCGKADAINEAAQSLSNLDYDVIGNLDSDVTFEKNYVAFVIDKFRDNPKLGIGGTPFLEGDYDSSRDSFEGENYVAGPFQLFRRKCFEEIGGYVPNAAGGIDWIAVMMARMKGWEVRSFPQKRFNHHRSMGTAQRSPLSALFSYGEKDYYLGNSPLWQLFRVGYRGIKPPYVTGGLALLSGYSWAAIRRIKRPVSKELMTFHRREQMRKLKAIARSVVSKGKVDAFTLGKSSSEC